MLKSTIPPVPHRADATLAWLLDHVPPTERNAVLEELCDRLRARLPRERRRPALRYDWRRLEKRRPAR